MTDQLMTLSVRTASGWAYISVAGEVDLSTTPRLQDVVTAAIEGGARHLIVDLIHLRFIDSAGLNVFVGAARQLGSEGSVRIVPGEAHLRKVLAISGLDRVFPLYDSLTEAWAGAPADLSPHPASDAG
jgi:anti-sigma B factor antagonist